MMKNGLSKAQEGCYQGVIMFFNFKPKMRLEHVEEYNTFFCKDPLAYDVVETYAQENFHKYTLKDPAQVKNIVIVGAYYGDEIFKYRALYRNANFYCFEPHKEHFKVLESKWKSNDRVKIYNVAASSEDGESKLYMTNANGNSSLLEFQGNQHGHPMYVVGEDKVKTVRLDSLSELQNINIDLMQVDTQGTELMVLKGATDILNNVDSLMLEVHTRDFIQPWDEEPYRGQCYLKQLIDFLADYDLKVKYVGLDNESGNGQGNSFWYRNKELK